MAPLNSKIALVTGAGRGIGRGIATRLAAGGATVIVTDVDEASAQQTAADLSAEGATCLGLPADVTSLDSVRTEDDSPPARIPRPEDPAARAPRSPEDSSSTLPWIGGGLLVGLALVGAGVVVRQRPRQ